MGRSASHGVQRRFGDFAQAGVGSWLLYLTKLAWPVALDGVATAQETKWILETCRWLWDGALSDACRHLEAMGPSDRARVTRFCQVDRVRARLEQLLGRGTGASSEASADGVGGAAAGVHAAMCMRVAYGAMLERKAVALERALWPAGMVLRGNHEGAHRTAKRQTALRHASACAAIWTSCHVHALAREHRWLVRHDDPDDEVRATCARVCDVTLATPLNELCELPPRLAYTSSSAVFPSSPRRGDLMQQLLCRATSTASRGWPNALRVAVQHPVVAHACAESLTVAMTGLHGCLAPSRRADWAVRWLIDRTLTPAVVATVLSKHAVQCASALKEALRRSVATALQDCAPCRAVLYSNGSAASRLTMPPEAAPEASLEASLVLIASVASDLVRHDSPSHRWTAPSAATVASALATAFVARPSPPKLRFPALGKPSAADAPLAKAAVLSLYQAMFQVDFAPLWVHSIRNGCRLQRMDAAQYDAIHADGELSKWMRALGSQTLCELQRAVLRQPSFYTWTLADATELCLGVLRQRGVDVDAEATLERAESRPEAGVAPKADNPLMGMPPSLGASIVFAMRTAWLREQMLAVDLGPRTRRAQLLALARRHGVFELQLDEDSESWLGGAHAPWEALLQSVLDGSNAQSARSEAVMRRAEESLAALPVHSTHACLCVECGRVANACRVAPHTFKASALLSGTRVAVNGKGGPPNCKWHASAHELGIECATVDVDDLDRIRCGKRASAALKTAMVASREATANAVDRRAVRMATRPSRAAAVAEAPGAEEIQSATAPNAMVVEPHDERSALALTRSSLARMRRDCKRSYEQRREPLACGTQCLVKFDCLGRAVRVRNRWYSLCCYCGATCPFEPYDRMSSLIACGNCIVAGGVCNSDETCRLSARMDAFADANERSVVQMSIGFRSSIRMRELPIDRACRFCERQCARRGRPFVVYASPHDRKGINYFRPPELRVTHWCPSHNRMWLERALCVLNTKEIIAYICENAKPMAL